MMKTVNNINSLLADINVIITKFSIAFKYLRDAEYHQAASKSMSSMDAYKVLEELRRNIKTAGTFSSNIIYKVIANSIDSSFTTGKKLSINHSLCDVPSDVKQIHEHAVTIAKLTENPDYLDTVYYTDGHCNYQKATVRLIQNWLQCKLAHLLKIHDQLTSLKQQMRNLNVKSQAYKRDALDLFSFPVKDMKGRSDYGK